MVKSGVHIINRLYADGQRAYTVRWCCPKTRRYKSRKVGPDRLLAEEERRTEANGTWPTWQARQAGVP